MFFVGTGMGTYEGVTDPMLLDIHRGKEGLYMNINHFFVTFGCLMITLYLLFLQGNWRNAMNQSAVAVFVLAVLFAFTKLNSETKTAQDFWERVRVLRQQKSVLILFFATICATGLELCLIGMMTTFLMELRGFSQVTSKVGLILFLSGIGLGRLFVGFLANRSRMLDLIVLLFSLSSGFLIALLLIRNDGFTYLFVFLSGASVSALFPLLIAYAGIVYKDISGTVLGIIKLAVPLGGIVLPLALSFISEYASLDISLMIFPLIALAGLALMLSSRNAFLAQMAGATSGGE
jgi:predicted MFS family arabinose efflux permease